MKENEKLETKPRRLSYSALKAFKRSPRHLLEYWKGEIKETPALLFGSLYHTIALEPEKFNSKFKIFDELLRPEKGKTMASKENKSWKFSCDKWAEDHNVKLITKEQYDKAMDMVAELERNPKSKELLRADGNKFEQRFNWVANKEECTGIKDIDNPYFIAELKSAVSAYPTEFHHQISKLGYWMQGGMYVDGTYYNDPSEHKDFYIIAQEKEEPYLVSVHRLSKDAISRGISEYKSLINTYKAIKNNLYRGYDFWSPFGEDGLFEYNIPKWMDY